MKKVFANSIDLKKITLLLLGFSMVIIMCSLTSCKKDKKEQPQDQIFKGPEVNMGNGKANSFFKIDGKGTHWR